MNITDLPVSKLKQIIKIKGQIETLQAKLSQLSGSASVAKKKGKAAKGPKKGKRKMSAAGRARISAAIKARWAKAKRAGKKKL